MSSAWTDRIERGQSHFCLTPHVAMRIGLYHPLLSHQGAWRIVSEDPCRTEVESTFTICRGVGRSKSTCILTPRTATHTPGLSVLAVTVIRSGDRDNVMCPVGRMKSVVSSSFGFLLIVRTKRIFTSHFIGTLIRPCDTALVPLDTRMFQHIAKFCNRQFLLPILINGYSYRRRLLGLDFTASLRRANRST